MTRSFSALFAIACAWSVAAQTTDHTVHKIIDHALYNSRAYEHLSYLCDNIGPRLSGSKGAELAVKWTTQQLRSWGIETRN